MFKRIISCKPEERIIFIFTKSERIVMTKETDNRFVAPMSPADFPENFNEAQDYVRSKDKKIRNAVTEKQFAECGLKLYKSGVLQWKNRTDEKPTAIEEYFLNWLPYYLTAVGQNDKTVRVLADFSFLMKRLRFGNVERVLLDYFLFRNKLSGASAVCDAFFDVICSNAHILRRNSKENPAYKIMLQIATEVADKCPVTQAAQRWINPSQGDSPCDWFWLNKAYRPKEYQPNPCKLVIEGGGSYAKLLSDGKILSYGLAYGSNADNNSYIWDPETGVCNAILEGHTSWVQTAQELKSGNIISCSNDKTMRLWSHDGVCKAVMKDHVNVVDSIVELTSGDIVSWCYYNEDNDDVHDTTLRLWSSDGKSKAVLKGHTDDINGVLELRSGDFISFSRDKTMRLWSPKGVFKAVFTGHEHSISNVLELQSGDILSWSRGNEDFVRIWSLDGNCKAVLDKANMVCDALELNSGDIITWSYHKNVLHRWSSKGDYLGCWYGHDGKINDVMKLQSGDVLSWSADKTLRRWSPKGKCKAVLKGHRGAIWRAFELKSGAILSWSKDDNSLRFWSPKGKCYAVLNVDIFYIHQIVELQSGDIVLRGENDPLIILSPDGYCKAVFEGHHDEINGVLEMPSGDLLSWSDDYTLCLWSSKSESKAVKADYLSIDQYASEMQKGVFPSWKNDRRLHIYTEFGSGFVMKPVFSSESADGNNCVELPSGDVLLDGGDVLYIFSRDGVCKAALESCFFGGINVQTLPSGDVISPCNENLLTWSPEDVCKAIQEGPFLGCKGSLQDIPELNWDKVHELLAPTGVCKAVMKGDGDVKGFLKMRSGDILSWNTENRIYLWHSNGACKMVLEGHTDTVNGVMKLKSDSVLSWSDDNTLRKWASNGECKAVLKGHKDAVTGALKLKSGFILSWSDDKTLRIWSPECTCKAVLKGHKDAVLGAMVLKYGDILSWSDDNTLRIWSPKGGCKAVLKGCTSAILDVLKLKSGDILTWNDDETMRLWSSDGKFKKVIDRDNPRYDSYYALFHKKLVRGQFFIKKNDGGIELQHKFKPLIRWNTEAFRQRLRGSCCDYHFLSDTRICVWFGPYIELLELNYGNHTGISINQAQQFLNGEIDESVF